jgi:hypothetical protein
MSSLSPGWSEAGLGVGRSSSATRAAAVGFRSTGLQGRLVADGVQSVRLCLAACARVWCGAQRRGRGLVRQMKRDPGAPGRGGRARPRCVPALGEIGASSHLTVLPQPARARTAIACNRHRFVRLGNGRACEVLMRVLAGDVEANVRVRIDAGSPGGHSPPLSMRNGRVPTALSCDYGATRDSN